jgi:hypothetical protein
MLKSVKFITTVTVAPKFVRQIKRKKGKAIFSNHLRELFEWLLESKKIKELASCLGQIGVSSSIGVF